jgi:hypothetical protein
MYNRHGPYGAGLKVKDKILLFQGVSNENGYYCTGFSFRLR